MYFKPAWVSAAIIKAPLIEDGILHKGAMILNQVDPLVQLFPELKSLFLIIERRGWHGMNDNRCADIKLVEDSGTLEQTRREFPNAVLLDMGPADFIDTSSFYPINESTDFDVIQVSCWSKRKRIELLIEAAALLPELSFVQMGHFENNGNAEEIAFRDDCIRLAKERRAHVTFPYASATHNTSLPSTKAEMNKWINRAKLGVLTTTSEGINRFKMECLAADRPVIVCDDVCVPTRKHINGRTGLAVTPTPESVADGIRSILSRRSEFQPRQYVLEHTGRTRSVALLKNGLREFCQKNDLVYHFDAIDWDGRNESLAWGNEAIELLTFITKKYHDAVQRQASVVQ